MGKIPKMTQAKRNRERATQLKRQEKEARRIQRKTEKTDQPVQPDEDDQYLENLRWGLPPISP
ncbi:MAG: hypothetical protein GKS05_10815 [Nitrospirales bacterium]|nr:hypothetical protein [Nitrospirales bacterium]